MKEYPKISGTIVKSQPIIAFDKLDGSNVRAEWSWKRGFYKFGTRKCMMDRSYPTLGASIDIILDKYADDLAMVFKEQKQRRAICFFEYYGPESFAGYHPKGENYTVTLFDVAFNGILEPKKFVRMFGHLDVPKVLYQGKVNQSFIDSVNAGTLDGMTYEGVICKGTDVTPGCPLMFKIKSNAWYNKLKQKCQDNQELYKELA